MPFLSNMSWKLVYKFTVRMAKWFYKVMAAYWSSWNYFSEFSPGTTFTSQLASTGRNKIEWPFFKRQKGHYEYPVLFQILMRTVFTQSQWVREDDSLTALVTMLLDTQVLCCLPFPLCFKNPLSMKDTGQTRSLRTANKWVIYLRVFEKALPWKLLFKGKYISLTSP